MYYFLFYQSRLIPRWLSVWGLAEAALAVVAGVFVVFSLISFLSATQVVMSIPIGVQEMVLAVWLIVRGFDVPAVASPSVNHV